jgi:hypothetical protein
MAARAATLSEMDARVAIVDGTRAMLDAPLAPRHSRAAYGGEAPATRGAGGGTPRPAVATRGALLVDAWAPGGAARGLAGERVRIRGRAVRGGGDAGPHTRSHMKWATSPAMSPSRSEVVDVSANLGISDGKVVGIDG